MAAFLALWALFLMEVQSGPLCEPPVTARAVLPRLATETWGYYSGGTDEEAETVQWSTVMYDPNEQYFIAERSYWLDCFGKEGCGYATSCNGGPSGSVYYTYPWPNPGTYSVFSCGTTGADSAMSTCVTEYKYESFGAQSPLVQKIGCSGTGFVPMTYYEKEPADNPTSTTTSSTTTPSTTSTSSPSASQPTLSPTSSSTTASPTPEQSSPAPVPPSSNNDTARTGIIAGSVVGGLVLLGALGLLAFFLIRRARYRDAAGLSGPGYVTAPPSQNVYTDKVTVTPGYNPSDQAEYRSSTPQTNHFASPQMPRLSELPEYRHQ